MGLFNRKTVLFGLSSLLVASSALFADAVVDAEFDNNENEFENYWYYFDDNAGVGAGDRPTAGAGTQQSVIDVPGVTKKPRNGYDGDTFEMNDYPFTPGVQLAEKFASMPFTMGEDWDAVTYTAQPFVGLGTMLAEDGKAADLTGATHVKFKIRSRVSTLKVTFKIQTLAIDQYSEVKVPPKGAFAYYEFEVPATTNFEEVSVPIADLALPAWAVGVNNHKIAFDIKTCTKLAWEVKKEKNTSTVTDTLDVDDVVIVGAYTFVSPTLWTKTADMTLPATGLFSNFEGEYPQTAPTGYWYAYNDFNISGNSTVDVGATKNEETGLLTLDFLDQSGSGDVGKGPMLQFTLGEAVKQGKNDVQGFVGIGVNVYDSSEAVYWDADAAGATSIYFHYKLDGDAKWATLEISDINDVGDKNEPGRKDGRGSGVVWYRNLPPTNAEWKAVEIPFSELVYHAGWDGSKNIPLDTKKLAKLQWKVQGGMGKSGAIQIDNIYFPGASGWDMPVKRTIGTAKNAAFEAMYLNGNVKVNWTNKTAVSNGTMNLITTQGKVVATASIAKTTNFSTDFSAKKLPSGMYFVKMSAVDINGKAIVSQSPITIVK